MMTTSHGVRLRLRALVALGWTPWLVADRAGLSLDTVAGLLLIDELMVDDVTAARVVAVYDELGMRLPPLLTWRDQDTAAGCRAFAGDRGWLPPLGLDDDHLDDPTWVHGLVEEWDGEPYDEAAVRRRLDGDRSVSLTHQDRIEVVGRAIARGMSYTQIAAVCGIQRADRYIIREPQTEAAS